LARTDLVDAQLALGRARDVVPELETLIEQSPLSERRRGQLMRALYLSGRQADALEHFRETGWGGPSRRRVSSRADADSGCSPQESLSWSRRASTPASASAAVARS
jgi:DNA-binding SARP family transcriptional activator